MCSWVLLWSRIGLFLLTNAGCICFTSECIPLICWAYFSDVMVSLRFRKLWWIRLAADQQTVTMTIFGASLALGSALELLLGPAPELVIACCCIQSVWSHITSNWEMVCCCIQEKTTLPNEVFFFIAWGTHLLSFYTCPVCFKCQTAVEWLTLNSWATSHVVGRGSGLMIFSVGHCKFPVAGHCASHLQGSHLLCKTSWTTTALYIH